MQQPLRYRFLTGSSIYACGIRYVLTHSIYALRERDLYHIHDVYFLLIVVDICKLICYTWFTEVNQRRCQNGTFTHSYPQ